MKKYYCIDCGKAVTKKSKRCRKCYLKIRKINAKSLQPNHCPDCGKEIHWTAKRCQSCSAKFRLRNPKNHSNWKGGLPNCEICGKKISRTAKICQECYFKILKNRKHKKNCQCCPCKQKRGEYNGKNNPNYKHNKTRNNKCIDCGIKISLLATRCKSCARKEQYKDPRNHPQWQNGISKEPYSTNWTIQLREKVRVRDNHICQFCGVPELECNRRLHIHHIDYNKKNSNLNNLISLCQICHNKTSCNRDYYFAYFMHLTGQEIEL